jgi:hypothetical protein
MVNNTYIIYESLVGSQATFRWCWQVHELDLGMVCPYLEIWRSAHLWQHSQCGKNNVQLKDIHMIYMEKRKKENIQGNTHGLMARSKQGMGLSTHQGPVTCMRALVGFVVGVGVVFGVVVVPVLGTCIPIITKLILGCPATEPPKLHIHILDLCGTIVLLVTLLL